MIWKKLAIACVAAIGLTALALHSGSGYSPSKVLCEKGLIEESEQLLPELSEPYTYLSHGRQSFVFESADKKTVLKLFNQTYFQHRWYHLFYVLPQWRTSLQEKISLRRLFYEKSYPLAQKIFPKETGILYIHLSSSDEKRLPHVALIDPSGRRQKMDLNQTAFVIQKKATPYLEHIQEIARKEGLQGLQREIDEWLHFCEKRIALGILDYDHDIWNNAGAFEGSLLVIDPGKFYQQEAPLDREAEHLEWWKATHRLYKWLLTNNLEAAKYLKDKVIDLCHDPS